MDNGNGSGNDPQFHNANNISMVHHHQTHDKPSAPRGDHSSTKSHVNPSFFAAPQDQASGQIPSQKQRYLDAMMLSSVSGGDPNRPLQPNHPDVDNEGSRRVEYEPAYATNGSVGHPEGGDMNYRTLRAIQLRGAPPPSHQQHHTTSHAHAHGPGAHNGSDKESFNSSQYYPVGPHQDRSARPSSMPPASASHGNHNYHNDLVSDVMDRRVSSSSMPSSVRSMSRENNSTNTSPHPMMPGYISQHVHDHDAYNYYMANKHGSHANSYYSPHYPIVSPEDTQEHLPLNNNGKIPYYPDDQRPPYPYSYMLGNIRHQDKRARHAYDTMNHEYSNFAGHQQAPPHQGFSRAEQDMMHHQQGSFMLPSFNDMRSHPHYNGIVHPHMGIEAPVPAPVKPAKTKKRYSGDMPRRPLTAYNFFFSEEREIILAQLPDEDDSNATNSEEGKENINGDNENDDMNPVEKILSNMRKLDDEETNSLRKKIRMNTERMLKIHKESDRVKKSHKKVHGKIAFQHLAKIVGQRWRNLHADEKKYYEDLASKDSNRYNEQLEEYNKKEQEAAVKKESKE